MDDDEHSNNSCYMVEHFFLYIHRLHHQPRHNVLQRKKNFTAYVGHLTMKRSSTWDVICAIIGSMGIVLASLRRAANHCQSSYVQNASMPETHKSCSVYVNSHMMNHSK